MGFVILNFVFVLKVMILSLTSSAIGYWSTPIRVFDLGVGVGVVVSCLWVPHAGKCSAFSPPSTFQCECFCSCNYMWHYVIVFTMF